MNKCNVSDVDLYTKVERVKMQQLIEKNNLLDPNKRNKYIREKKKREKLEKLADKMERKIEIMY